jgi:hypothetical protein
VRAKIKNFNGRARGITGNNKSEQENKLNETILSKYEA